jgi:hypothetical protein
MFFDLYFQLEHYMPKDTWPENGAVVKAAMFGCAKRKEAQV